MGIKTARGKYKREDPAFTDVKVQHWQGGEPDTFRFRRPTSRALSPTPEVMERIGKAAPSLPPDSRFEVSLLAECYMPDESDGTVVAEEEFARLAVSDDLFFQSIVQAFTDAFPEFTQWLLLRAQAGNVSGGGLAGSVAGSTSLPSDSGASPQNSPT